jgi:tripeptidyl-peptidase-1
MFLLRCSVIDRVIQQIQGEFWGVFGTSASAPVVGAILTLVNDARLSAGKKPIGFINPTVYYLPCLILT